MLGTAADRPADRGCLAFAYLSSEKSDPTLGYTKRRRRPGREAYFERIRADQRTAIGFLLGRKKGEQLLKVNLKVRASRAE